MKAKQPLSETLYDPGPIIFGNEINLKTNGIDKDIEVMKQYLLLKFRQGDWHGVSDAANDLREMEAGRVK